MFADQIDRSPGPDLVAKEDVRLREILHVGGGDRALADHLLFQGSGGRRPFVERPGDGRRVVDGDPIDLRRGESGVVGGVVDRRHVDHLHLVDHGIDLDGRPCASRYQAAVDQESVLVRAHAGDKSGVIGPGDRGIDGGHARSDALPDEAAQGGYGQTGVVQGVGGKAVQMITITMRCCGGVWADAVVQNATPIASASVIDMQILISLLVYASSCGSVAATAPQKGREEIGRQAKAPAPPRQTHDGFPIRYCGRFLAMISSTN